MDCNKKIISGSINVENGATWYHVRYFDYTEEDFFPYLSPVPVNVIKFFKDMSDRNSKLLERIYGSLINSVC